MATIVVLTAGCGDSGPGDATSTAAIMSNINRPAPDTVEIIDSLKDISASDPNLQSAPAFLDINRSSVSKEGNNIKFTMELASALPEGPQPGTAVEWGFLLDVDQDGTPDWGVFADLTAKDGWLPGIYNQKTKQRLAGPQYPGTFSHTGTTIILAVDSGSLGSPVSFKWFAYTDAAMTAGANKTQKAGDKIWEPAAPDNSENWLPFP